MSYSLGVDLGATTCSAAIRRGLDIEPCAIGEVETTMPAVALPRRDGSVLVGEAADQRSWYEPTLVARTVAPRVGEPEPVVIDGVTCDPGTLTEALVGTVIHRASAPGEWPGHLVLTYPLRHGGAVEDLLEQAAARVTTSPVMLVPEPIAAMAKLAHDVELALDTTVMVVDFGGSSFDVTLVRRTDTGFDLIGEPASLPDFGGVEIDTAVLAHVESMIGDVSSAVATSDHAGMLALRRLRRACRAAKETLSSLTETVIDVDLPHAQGQVTITRDDLERAIGGRLIEAVDMIETVVADAGLTLQDVHVALVVGGSSRIPLLSALINERVGLPIVADPLPELTVGLGAALFAEEQPGEAAPVLSPMMTSLTGGGLVPAVPAVPVPPPPGPQPDADFWGPEPGPVADVGDLGSDAGAAVTDSPWADPRTSVFDEPVGPATGAAMAQDADQDTGFMPPATAYGAALAPEVDDDPFRSLTTSDTDPFGLRSGSGGRLARREYEEAEEPEEYEEPKRGFGDSTDPRMIVGAIGAGLAIVLLGGFALAAGTGGGDDEPTIAVRDPLPTEATTTTLSTSTTTAPTTTTEEPPETTQRSTTTTQPRPTTTAAPPPTEPPPPPPPPPTTATTVPTTTTSTTTPTTTTNPPGPPGPP
jgi:actin-like ATPase involved in cell morphogenesis